jgi:hypothetical protein
MSLSIFILLGSGCVAAAALRTILSAHWELINFNRGLKNLPSEGFTEGVVFQGRYESSRLASEFLRLCSHAVERNVLGALNVERATAPLLGYLRTRVNIPRTWAGVLVLCGLLVTLLNLQGSVGALGTSFENLSKHETSVSQSRADQSVKDIQAAMGKIAEGAHDAFLYSFVIVFLAATILGMTLLLNNKVQRCSREFLAWATSTYLEALANRPAAHEMQVEKLGELIGKLVDVAAALDGMAPALNWWRLHRGVPITPDGGRRIAGASRVGAAIRYPIACVKQGTD